MRWTVRPVAGHQNEGGFGGIGGFVLPDSSAKNIGETGADITQGRLQKKPTNPTKPTLVVDGALCALDDTPGASSDNTELI